MVTALFIALFIALWFGASLYMVLAKLGSIMGGNSKKTNKYVEWFLMAPMLAVLIIADWLRKLADKHCK